MRKVVILTLVTLFTCVEYSQAQTTEKEMTRQEKKAAQEALDKAGRKSEASQYRARLQKEFPDWKQDGESLPPDAR